MDNLMGKKKNAWFHENLELLRKVGLAGKYAADRQRFGCGSVIGCRTDSTKKPSTIILSETATSISSTSTR